MKEVKNFLKKVKKLNLLSPNSCLQKVNCSKVMMKQKRLKTLLKRQKN